MIGAMAYCGPRGIPYTWFTGQTEKQRWDDLSRAAAVAWQIREGDRCGGCGQFRSDWLDDDGKELEVPPAEVVDRYCPACFWLHIYGKDHENESEDIRAGFHPSFRPFPPGDASSADAVDVVSVASVNGPGDVDA